MSFTKKFLWFSGANVIVFYLAYKLFGSYSVFGNAVLSSVQAVIVTATLVGFIIALVEPTAKNYKLKFSDNVWMVIYFAVNTLTIYLLARTPISVFVGLGIVGFWVSLVLGFVATFAQYSLLKTALNKK